MNREFLELYNEELRHIRERAGEFAAAYPKIAGRLALEQDAKDACADPFVERLLEGFAYLAARVQLKLEAQFPRFTQGILETVFPDYMAPWPSATIVRFEPKWSDKALMDGVGIPRGLALDSLRVKNEATTCRFSTAHDIKLYPFDIVEAEYHTRNISELNIGRFFAEGRAALRLRLRIQGSGDQTFSKVACERLPIYVHGDDQLPATILEQIFAHGTGVLVRVPGDTLHKNSSWLPKSAIEHVGFAEDEAMLPFSPRSFEGHRILREHFLLPQRNLFFGISKLREAFSRIGSQELDLIIPLRERNEAIQDFVTKEIFKLYCSPAINLFRRRADRIPLGPGFTEYQVIVDRNRMTDYEVYAIEEVTGYGRTSTEQVPFHPFYLQPPFNATRGGFYSVNRLPRNLSEKEKKFGAKSTYPGSEVYLSLVDAAAAPFSPNLEQLGVKVICTNRHLPLGMPLGLAQTDFVPESSLPVASVRCLVRPTSPRAATSEGKHAWRAISHLSLNHLSLVERGNEGADAMRELLRLYAHGQTLQTMVDGLTGIQSQPGMVRCPGGGPVVFIRGIEVNIILDEDRYAGRGVFAFGSVLEQFLARHVSTNAYVRTTLRTLQRKEVIKWPPKVGAIPIA